MLITNEFIFTSSKKICSQSSLNVSKLARKEKEVTPATSPLNYGRKEYAFRVKLSSI
jgi:hypothetical protein